MKAIWYFPDKQSILLKSIEWNLWLNKTETRDGRIMFPLSVNKVIYNPETNEFNYERLREDSIWLSKENILEFIEILYELIK